MTSRPGTNAAVADARPDYEDSFELAAIGIAFCSLDGRFLRVNRALCELTGYTSEELRARDFQSITHPDDLVYDLPLVQEIATGRRQRFHREKRYLAKDGRVIWALLSVAHVPGPGSAAGCNIVTIEDITARKDAELQLANSKREYQHLADRHHAVILGMAEGVVFQAEDGTLVSVNPAAQRILGLSEEQLLGRTSETPGWEAIHEDGTPFPGQLHPAMVTLRTGEPMSDVVMGVRRPDASVVWISINSRRVSSGDGRTPAGVVTTFRDITSQKRLELALLEAADREQRRLGMELHDGLGQELTGLALMARALARAPTAGGEADVMTCERIAALANQALRTCRSIARGLSPLLDAGGDLGEALKSLADRVNGPPGPAVRYAATGSAEISLPTATLEHLYRICQEALANALRHDSTTEVRIALTVEPSRVRVEVWNDGQVPVGGPPATYGSGLRTMRLRAERIGAQLTAAAATPSGWSVVCEVEAGATRPPARGPAGP